MEEIQKRHFQEKLIIKLIDEVEQKLKEQLDNYTEIGEETISFFLNVSGKFLENKVIYQELMKIIGRHGFVDEDILEIKSSSDKFPKIMITLNIL